MIADGRRSSSGDACFGFGRQTGPGEGPVPQGALHGQVEGQGAGGKAAGGAGHWPALRPTEEDAVAGRGGREGGGGFKTGTADHI